MVGVVGETQALKSMTSGRVQPDRWMICVAAQIPHLPFYNAVITNMMIGQWIGLRW